MCCKFTAIFRYTQTFTNFSPPNFQIFHRKLTFCKLRLCKFGTTYEKIRERKLFGTCEFPSVKKC